MPTREPELYKDKIEVSLDGRQIFYLFFGGAVIVGLVFVLGVMVGRRVEARSHVAQARTQATSDPLAALDHLESTKPRLSFQRTLSGSSTTTEVDRKIEALAKTRTEPAAPAEKADKKADKKDQKPEKADKPDKPDKAAKTDKADKVADAEKPRKKADKLADSDKSDKPRKADKVAVSDKPDKADKADKADSKADKPVTKPDQVADKPKRSRYTLQLSSFQDRQEADAFLSSVKAAGYPAHITEAEVSGNTFFRVRYGSYASLDDANDAKSEVEKAINKSASVMRL